MVDYRRSSELEKKVASRAFSHFYPWILAGLFLLFFITFPIFKEPMLISIPVAATGWFYYWRAGVIASLLGILINVILTFSFKGRADWYEVLAEPGLVIGSIFLIVVSLGIGYLREVIESLHQRERLLESEERFLTLLGIMIRKILEHSNWSNLNENGSSQLFFDIAHHLTNLFVADHGHLIRWSSAPERALLVASTNADETPAARRELDPENSKMISQGLQTGQPLAIENLAASPYTGTYAFINPNGTVQSVLCIPLTVREYQFGVAILAYETTHRFAREEIMYAERLSHQVALALWGLRQDQVNIQQLNETLIMMKIGRALSETERIGLDTVLQLIVDSARELIPEAEKTVIHLLDRDDQSLVPRATSGFQSTEKTMPRLRMHIGNGAAGQVLQDGITVNIADVNSDPRFLHAAVKPAYRSLLVSPVQTAGEQLGTISVESAKSHAFSEHEAKLLTALGNQAAIAIENTHLFETTLHSLEELGALYRINQRLAASLDPDILMKEVVELLQESFQYYHVEIYEIDPEQRSAVLRHASGEIGMQLKNMSHHLLPGEGIVGHVAYTTRPFFTNDVDKIVFFTRHPLLPETKSELAAPIMIDGQVIGVLDIQQAPPRRLTERDLQIAGAVAEQLAVALQKANLYTDLQTALEHEQNMRSQLIQAERLSMMGKLLASVSHELNNPLQTIQNALFLTRQDLEQANFHLEDMDIIASEIDRMAALLERLRATYRPLQLEDFGPVMLTDIIEETYRLISTYLRHKNISFEFHPSPELLPVAGLSNHLKQVLLNLFINSVEAMPQGGHLCVDVSLTPENDEVVLSLQDSGTGFERELLPRIFDPFVTNKKTGTGLGLTITHDIIEQHRGRILAENIPAGGAKVNIWLPAWKETVV